MRQALVLKFQRRREIRALVRAKIQPARRRIGPRALGQVLEIQPSNPDAVEMVQPLRVEHGVGAVHPLQPELLHQLVQVECLALVPRRPAQKHQEVDQRFRQVALRSVFPDPLRAVSLREFLAPTIHHQRQVGKDRRRPAKRFIQQHLPKRVGDVVLAANHMADLHVVVVHHDRHVVQRRTVTARNDEVINVVRTYLDGSKDDILIANGLGLVSKSDSWNHAGCLTLGDLGFGEVSAHARISLWPALGSLLLALGGAFLGRCVVVVRVTTRYKLLHRLAVDVVALALPVGTVGSVHVGTFVPVKPKPAQAVEYPGFPGWIAALRICVLDTQHKCAANPSGHEVVEEGGTGAPHMQVARGTRRHADANGLAHGAQYLTGSRGIGRGGRLNRRSDR